MRVRDEAIHKESLGGKEEKRCVRVPARTGGSVRIREEGLHSLARVPVTQQPPLPPHSYRLHVLGPRYYYIQY